MGDVERLGILGGTFDPFHVAHRRAAEAARDALRLDRVILMPAGDPWRKREREVTPATHRLAMVHAAVAAEPGLEVCDLEVRREGPSYTAETLHVLQADDRALWFILGADALLDLPYWQEPEAIIQRARLAVLERRGVSLDQEMLDSLLPGLGAVVDWVSMDAIDISSTDLRQRLVEGLDVSQWVPAAVLEYAREHGLYRR